MLALSESASSRELPIVEEVIGVVGENKNIHSVGYDKMKLHNAHRVMRVAVVLKPFHALPDEQRPFRTVAMLFQRSSVNRCLTDRQTDAHCWFADDVD